MSGKTDEIAGKFLGKKVSGSSSYDPSLLVAVPRIENRKQYNIDNENLPFEGFDVWHLYEFSALTENGLPVTRVLKIKYSCNSDFIVESKSLKLYLNSFNMSRFGNTVEDCIKTCCEKIKQDLSRKLETTVEIGVLDSKIRPSFIFSDYKNLMEVADVSKIEVTKFKEAPELLEVENIGKRLEYRLSFDSLRSNCRVTHQPDFGDVFIYYKSCKHIKEESLIKYLSSFRSEYHFHEECCEMIYKRMYDLLDREDELLVSALYTRRGGIDICPARWSKNCSVEDISLLADISKLARCGIKQ